jgi:hypothetical protein
MTLFPLALEKTPDLSDPQRLDPQLPDPKPQPKPDPEPEPGSDPDLVPRGDPLPDPMPAMKVAHKEKRPGWLAGAFPSVMALRDVFSTGQSMNSLKTSRKIPAVTSAGYSPNSPFNQ